MSEPKKIMCFTHWDLDGVVSYLVLRWAFPKANIDYAATTVQNFRSTFITWLTNHDLEDYDKVFIMDLGIYEDKDLIDHDNVFIIDHHPGHDASTYKNAKTAIKSDSENIGSACMLAYKIFKGLYNTKLSKPQLHLLLLATDFDSYKLELPESAKLNVVFWDTDKKFESFIKSFISGFRGFSDKQQNIIKIHDFKLQKIRDEIEVHGGLVDVLGKKKEVRAVFATQYINEVADILIADYEADVALVINTKTDHVSYRKNPNCDTDLSELATVLADGAGHEYSSGSKISKEFIEFTKQFERVDNLTV